MYTKNVKICMRFSWYPSFRTIYVKFLHMWSWITTCQVTHQPQAFTRNYIAAQGGAPVRERQVGAFILTFHYRVFGWWYIELLSNLIGLEAIYKWGHTPCNYKLSWISQPHDSHMIVTVSKFFVLVRPGVDILMWRCVRKPPKEEDHWVTTGCFRMVTLW